MEGIDDDYMRKGSALASDMRKTAYFVTEAGAIGPLGIAFALHRRLWLQDRAFSAETFGDALAKRIVAPSGTANLDRDHLRAWVQASRPVSLPDVEHVDAVLDALQVLARDCGLSDAAVSALRASWRHPSDLLERLRKDEGDGGDHGFMPVDPVFTSALGPDDKQAEALADLIRGQFAGRTGRERIIAVLGPRFSGKRSAIARLVQSCRSSTGEYALGLLGGGSLPLFARNVETMPFEQVIFDIALFLGVDVSPERPLAAQVDALLARIRDKSRSGGPFAAYVLADVPMTGELLANLLANEQLQRLIDALFCTEESCGNRLLLTGEYADWIGSYPISRVPELGNRADFRSVATQYGLNVRSPVAAAESADAPFVTLLAALMNSDAWGRTDEQLASAKRAAQAALDERLTNVPHYTAEASIGRRDLVLLAHAIFEQLESEPGTLDALEYITISEDGVRRSSLTTLRHRRTGASSGDACAEAQRDAGRLLMILPTLCRYTEDTLTADEHAPASGKMDEHKHLYKVLVPFRKLLEAAFAEREARGRTGEFRRKNWEIARLAREKSRWKRINAQSRFGLSPLDLLRDVQALRHAQIALDATALATAGTSPGRKAGERAVEIGTVRTLERLVFSGAAAADISGANCVAMFRYLYFDVFRDDMDQEHRLSVQYHRDDLRLNLLLGFCNPGRPFYPEDIVPHTKALAGWNTLSHVLSEHERAELLVSIAISAKRTGAWSVLREASAAAQAMVARNSQIALLDRVFRCDVDAAILRCGSSDTPTLADIEGQIKDRIVLLSRFGDDLRRCRSAGKSRQFVEGAARAEVKWRARLGEVLMLRGQLDSAREEFGRAESMAYSQALKCSSELRWKRSALLGYGARRYCRLLCELARRAADETERRRLLDAAEGLNDLTLSRMSRFPREGALLLLDRAAILLLRNDIAEMEALLEKLPNATMGVLGSFAARVETDVSHAALLLELVERKMAAQDTSRIAVLLEEARQVILRVLRLCTVTGKLPLYMAFAEMSAARWLGLSGSNPTAFDGRSPEELAETAREVFDRAGYALQPCLRAHPKHWHSCAPHAQ